MFFVIEVHLFIVWLYYDFSGYSDVAVGVGRLIGVSTPENFDRPYAARNLVEFWEHWHISLGQFFRRNVFMPLQLNLLRYTDGAHMFPVSVFVFFVSFLSSGLWHSLAPGYLMWAVASAVGVSAVIIYRHLLKKRLSSKQYKQYLAHPGIRAVSTFITLEYFAWSIYPVIYFPSW